MVTKENRVGEKMNIREKIVNILVERLSVEIEDRNNIDYNLDLFSSDEEEGFGLDSVDALEIVVAVKNEFGIDLRNVEDIKSILKNINTLASYIERQQ